MIDVATQLPTTVDKFRPDIHVTGHAKRWWCNNSVNCMNSVFCEKKLILDYVVNAHAYDYFIYNFVDFISTDLTNIPDLPIKNYTVLQSST